MLCVILQPLQTTIALRPLQLPLAAVGVAPRPAASHPAPTNNNCSAAALQPQQTTIAPRLLQLPLGSLERQSPTTRRSLR